MKESKMTYSTSGRADTTQIFRFFEWFFRFWESLNEFSVSKWVKSDEKIWKIDKKDVIMM